MVIRFVLPQKYYLELFNKNIDEKMRSFAR